MIFSNRLGSPSTSLEAVGTTGQQGVVTCTPKQWEGSDDETGELEADWSSHVSADILHTLTDSEKRRQEIINGEFVKNRHCLQTADIHYKNCIFLQKFIKRSAIMCERCDC